MAENSSGEMGISLPEPIPGTPYGPAREKWTEQARQGNIPDSVKAVTNTVDLVGGARPASPDRIDGDDGEKWPKWLIEKRDEIDQITNTKLKMKIRLLARRDDSMAGADVLRESFNEIDKMIGDGEISLADAALWQSRISLRHEQLLGAGKRESLQPVPLYFGAVFEGGKNAVHVDRHDLIPTLDLTDKEGRDEFIFRNLYAFNYRFTSPDSWNPVVQDWVVDAKVARDALAVKGINIDSAEFDKFEKKVQAMMAVTASARAMEASGGVYKNYLIHLVGREEGKEEPNTGAQESMADLLLHASPDKMIRVLEDPLVKKYYEQIMFDAGLVCDADHEWKEYKDPADPTGRKMIQVASGLEFTSRTDVLRNSSPLVGYMENQAEKGGMQKYIEERLLDSAIVSHSTQSDNERRAAAKLATDLFMVDKFTRWNFALTDNGKLTFLKLQPGGNWGGDPLGSIIQPSLPLRIKGVYGGEHLKLLDHLDETVRDEANFEKVRTKYAGWKDVDTVIPVVPSMVANLKRASRLSDAMYKITAGAMATGLADFSPKTQGEMVTMAELLDQVYGGLSVKKVDPASGEVVKDPVTGKPVEVNAGKEICGQMMTDILWAKAKAAILESARPKATDVLKTMYTPLDRGRPNLESLQFLFGPNLDGNQGFFYTLQYGPRFQMVIDGNMFDSKKTKESTLNMLATNDVEGKMSAKTLRRAGKALRILEAITGVATKR